MHVFCYTSEINKHCTFFLSMLEGATDVAYNV